MSDLTPEYVLQYYNHDARRIAEAYCRMLAEFERYRRLVHAQEVKP